MACYYFGSFLENVVSQLLKLEIRSKNVSLWSGIQVYVWALVTSLGKNLALQENK